MPWVVRWVIRIAAASGALRAARSSGSGARAVTVSVQLSACPAAAAKVS